jgi:hypothetical protein
MPRKTPILLCRGPLSGRIDAVYRYTRKPIVAGGKSMICAATDGKQDITADFDALVCEYLLSEAPDIIAILDGVAMGMDCDEDERKQARAFREQLKLLVERHNAGPHGRHVEPDRTTT